MHLLLFVKNCTGDCEIWKMRQEMFKVSLLKAAFRSFTGGAQNVRRGVDPFATFKAQPSLAIPLDPACSLITQVIIS